MKLPNGSSFWCLTLPRRQTKYVRNAGSTWVQPNVVSCECLCHRRLKQSSFTTIRLTKSVGVLHVARSCGIVRFLTPDCWVSAYLCPPINPCNKRTHRPPAFILPDAPGKAWDARGLSRLPMGRLHGQQIPRRKPNANPGLLTPPPHKQDGDFSPRASMSARKQAIRASKKPYHH